METNMSSPEIAKDVLHNEDHSKLTQEEIAKAVAHHNKRHKEDPQQNAPQEKRPEKSK